MRMPVTTGVRARRLSTHVSPQRSDALYACGYRLGYAVGTLCASLGLVRSPQPTLERTAMLRPHEPHLDRTVPVHPRVLDTYTLPVPNRIDRQALRRAVLCACSLPLTKRLVQRLLRHSILVELALAAAALFAMAALGSPVTLEDVLRQLAGLATVAFELLLVALVGALAAEILLSAFAVVQAALSE